MSKLVARIKMLPSESDADIDSIPRILRETLPEGFKLLAHKKEPIAFGLYSLLADFTLDDSEGQMELLEESIKKVEAVGEIEIINVSRQSVSIK
ncbi:MAG: elongation factor 1-beta [Nitrososphaeraceae archaeon]|jgi:elongation factor 1-beta|nr:elongation factor 1-beta [Nitrososphaeraceae archaeon]RPI84912.1 MAG: elongation factor 1-beta [Nitrosopumilales archaeon]